MLTALAWLALPVLLAVVVHEVAHGWVARAMGDDTAYRAGRLSLNPLSHVDPLGSLLVPALTWLAFGFVFAWARPVPVAYHRLSPAQGALVALAGPLANGLLCMAWLAVAMLAQRAGLQGLELMARIGVLANAALTIVNALPIPPLDGWRVVLMWGTRARA